MLQNVSLESSCVSCELAQKEGRVGIFLIVFVQTILISFEQIRYLWSFKLIVINFLAISIYLLVKRINPYLVSTSNQRIISKNAVKIGKIQFKIQLLTKFLVLFTKIQLSDNQIEFAKLKRTYIYNQLRIIKMSVILKCSHQDQPQPYIGVDSGCRQPAIFCVEHDPHKNKQGLLHQMMPLSHFKRSINEMKFKMADKVGDLIDQYSNFMDELIKEITQLKLRKTVELSMLWLRELSSNQQQYENLRKIYRNDYDGFTCSDIHWLYFKILGNQKLQRQKLEDISCYKDICKVMKTLHESAKGRILIAQKVMELEGVVQKGELLRRALPDRKIFRQNTKQILLQGLNNQLFDIKYNKVALKENTRGFNSIFSKYPLIPHTNYNMLINTKYTNIMIGVCEEGLKLSEKEAQDLHYNPHSIVYNCSNGCTYRDGMFQSGSSHLTKGQKELEMIFRITDTQFIILIGKNVVCRANIQKYKKDRLFLHMLMRTKGDFIEIDRDKSTLIPQIASEKLIQPSVKKFSQAISEVNQVEQVQNSIDMKTSNAEQEQRIYVTKNIIYPISDIIKQAKETKHSPGLLEVTPMAQSLFQNKKENNLIKSKNLLQSLGLKKSIPLQSSMGLQIKNKDIAKYQQDSKVCIQVQNSMFASQAEQISSKYASNCYDDGLMKLQAEEGKQSLLNPAVIERLKKSQFQISLKSSAIDNKFQLNQISPPPSIRRTDKKMSGFTNPIRNTQYYDDDD